MFNRFKTKSKLITVSALAAVAVCFYIAVFFATGYAEDMTRKAEEKRSAAETSAARIDKIKKLMAETPVEQTQVAGYVVTDEHVVTFIEEVESLARRAGVEGSVDTVTTGSYPDVDVKQWEGLSVLISTTGSWADTYQFLSLLERLPYQSNIKAAQIQKSDPEKENNELWEGDFTLVVLKQK